MQTLTKIDAARRQLVTAIKLFFAEGDAVSVFSLAANAWEIIDALCGRAGIKSLSLQTEGNLRAGQRLKRDYINEPYRNFFKHADRDPDASVDFNERDAEAVMMLAVEDYLHLQGAAPIEFQVYQAWYLARYPHAITAEKADEISGRIANVFPDFESLDDNAQLEMGQRVLSEALANRELTADCRTEPST